MFFWLTYEHFLFLDKIRLNLLIDLSHSFSHSFFFSDETEALWFCYMLCFWFDLYTLGKFWQFSDLSLDFLLIYMCFKWKVNGGNFMHQDTFFFSIINCMKGKWFSQLELAHYSWKESHPWWYTNFPNGLPRQSYASFPQYFVVAPLGSLFFFFQRDPLQLI